MPKRLREMLGERMKLLPDQHCGVVYKEGTRPNELIASLEAIIAELRAMMMTETREQ